jgi:hypothetical protein
MGGWLPDRGPDGSATVIPEPRQGSSLVVVTHNWCDKTTWYQQSDRIVGEILNDSGDGKTHQSANQHWIDMTHGKVYREDTINTQYLPIIKVGGVVKTERTPWKDVGGDFTINYATGVVTFFEVQTETVMVDYSSASSSLFTIAPNIGKILTVENSEVQFSADINMLDSIHFQPWAFDSGDLPNKIPVAEKTTYKTIRDYVDEAAGVYPEIPSIGGASRGLNQPHVVFPFSYKTVKTLYSSMGLEIRIQLDEDIGYGGEFSSATFYCTSKAEL